ncbi:SGNH/GDSL hydrolase family protein [Aquabacterium sp. J223]|uniref:SGNH/GDSL hydrolase family protein n=1 Tax=Aquabacterium sp. J223 TaxID=2898431 RepID=UPI0021AE144C|nr:SGNH/GDSL hydrolase family protein [Aquabacterium sp. J223]UUX96955.1 SGNH/GDSL hydrolase family protein [Aquabacterium sp. J223]
MRDGNVFWDKQALENANETADILAAGDSWFWYPFPGGSLITGIGALVAHKGHNILVEGSNGVEAYDLVKGKYKRQVNEMLRLYGSGASAFLISAGGNDFAGFNDLRPLLRADCSAATSAAECFKPGAEEGTVEWLFQKVYENYATLITRALFVMPGHARIIVHTYAYSLPTGKGVNGGAGWIKPALDAAQVPLPLQARCLVFLLDHFHSVLSRLVAGSAGRVELVDSRSALSPADWANELHPTPKGFRKVVEKHWAPVLHRLELA